MTQERHSPQKIVRMEGVESSGCEPNEDSNPTAPTMRHSKRPLSLTRKFVFASLSTIVFFAGVEGLLRLFIAAPIRSDSRDPFVGFEGSQPVFQVNGSGGEALARTSEPKLVWFNDQQFSVAKPPDTIRVACLGGSTTFGRPFDDRTSFAGWLRELFPTVDADHQWEVINAGGVSYASYRVARVMEELAAYDVDIYILYTGQNEFLEWRTYGDLIEGNSQLNRVSNVFVHHTRIGALIRSGFETTGLVASELNRSKQVMPDDVDEMLNHSIGPRDYQRDVRWAGNVVAHFEHNLGRMREIARRAGARFVLVSPISKLRDCTPFKAEFAASLDPKTRSELSSELDTALQNLARGEFETALAHLDAVIKQDTQHAGVHYYRGQALFELGRFEEARVAYQQAIDQDICPLRATTSILESIARVASTEGVIHVDMDHALRRELRDSYGHECPGKESFLDHVHPTIEIHRLIALQTIEALGSAGVGIHSPTPEQLAEADAEVLEKIDSQEMGVAFRNLAKIWHWSGKFSEAIAVARDALRLIPDDLETRFVLADSLATLGETDKAVREYEALFERGDHPLALLAFGELLLEEGHHTAAKAFLLQAAMVNEGDQLGRAYYSLGELHSTLREHNLALECLERARKLLPDDERIEAALRRQRKTGEKTIPSKE